jgi:hypothetical protein
MAEKKTPVTFDQARQAVEKIKPYLEKASPYVRKAHDVYIQYYPQAKEYYVKAADYVHPEVVLAIILLLFGGQFALTIVAFRAFQASGGKMIKSSWAELETTYREGMTNLHKDADTVKLFDADGDGTVSVWEVGTMLYQITIEKDAAQRQKRMQVVAAMLKCIDPQKILDAVGGLWTGIAAVLATLRSEVARYVTIGTHFGLRVADVLKEKTSARVVEAFPQYSKWIDAGYRAAGAILGIFFAFLLTRTMMAFTCAVEGGKTASAFLLLKGKDMGHLTEMQVEKYADPVAYGMSALGFLFQFSYGFGAPWYVRPVLLPALMLEWTLGYVAMR